VIRAKLSPAERLVQIECSIGRDVLPSDIPAMVALLAQWHQQTENMAAALERRINDVRQSLHVANHAHTGNVCVYVCM
jgi:hypothetical protein